jgi:hypothetical protein
MRIDSSGNVGIGASNPAKKLVVSDGTQLTASTGGSIYLVTGNNDGAVRGAGIDTYSVTAGNDHGLRFYTNAVSTAPAERMRLDSSGNLLVGTTSQIGAGRLCISVTGNTVRGIEIQNTNTSNVNAVVFRNSSAAIVGTITNSTTSTVYGTSSDYRLKENVVDLDNGIDRLKQIPVHRFNFIADPDTTVDGFIAHEVQDVVPEAITGTKDGMTTEEYEVSPAVLDEEGNVVTEAVMGTREVPEYQGIDQSKLVPLLTAALQEAVTRIETLEAEVAALKGA